MKNTFGRYIFPEWVTQEIKESIVSFWGIFGRTHRDWLENAERDARDNCSHVRGGGFGNPKLGALVAYRLRNGDIVIGRYIHAWNNMGRVVDAGGVTHYVSSCDIWCKVEEQNENN